MRGFAIGTALLFLTIICGLAARGRLPMAVAVVYVAASVAAAIAYGMDKSAARSGAWRTPESTLHALAVIGGWPGALVAQRVFGHKTRKVSFRVAFWATVAANCGALAWVWWMTGP
jgi:uncharacterized membrane protein YsdA (DUF1294 family)